MKIVIFTYFLFIFGAAKRFFTVQLSFVSVCTESSIESAHTAQLVFFTFLFTLPRERTKQTSFYNKIIAAQCVLTLFHMCAVVEKYFILYKYFCRYSTCLNWLSYMLHMRYKTSTNVCAL